MWVFPLRIVIFHDFSMVILVYQRVHQYNPSSSPSVGPKKNSQFYVGDGQEYEGDSRLPADRQSTYAMDELSGRELTSLLAGRSFCWVTDIYIYMYVYIYICICMYVYIYIYNGNWVPSGVIKHGLLEHGLSISDFPNKPPFMGIFQPAMWLMTPEGHIYHTLTVLPRPGNHGRKHWGKPRNVWLIYG